MTKEEFMMEAALRLLSLNRYTASRIAQEVKELTGRLFNDVDTKSYEFVPLSEVLEHVDNRYSSWFESGFNYEGLSTIGDLLKYPPKSCLKFKNIGRKGVRDLDRVLMEKYGIEDWLKG